MKRVLAVLLAGTWMLLGAGTALAWNVSGKVLCVNGDTKTPLAGVTVIVAGVGKTVTDATGYYEIGLPDESATYTESLGDGLPPDAIFVNPSSNSFTFSVSSSTTSATVDWNISSAVCQRACWLTGGGEITAADTNGQPIYSFGGNVNPGCSPTAGQGGEWNTIDHIKGLHFEGRTIQVVRCGNIAGIPEGSKSPVTPFNFIEYKGTGTLKGVEGNKADYGTVYFFARAEDRGEPGKGTDRLFLNVFSDPNDPVGTSLLLIDVDGNPATIDPVTITGGNLQLHISGCDKQAKP
jgi:hypothetical protein